MNRIVLFALALLSAGVVTAAEPPEADRVADATDAQAQAEAPDGETASGTTEAQAEAPDGETASGTTEAASGAEPSAGATETQAQTQDGPKVISGMSVLGNQEAPKSLVIVPWKSSELGDSLGISPLLDDSRQPVDKDVFMRSLNYYEIRSETDK